MQAESKQSNQTNDNDDTTSSIILTDGLLTSLTDAAISNLSQLAALQERCESQQQHHSHRYNQAAASQPAGQQQAQEEPAFVSTSGTTLTSPSPTATASCADLIQKVVSSPYNQTLALGQRQNQGQQQQQQQRGTQLLVEQHSSQLYQHPHLSQHQQQPDTTSPSDDDLFEDLLRGTSGLQHHQQAQQRPHQHHQQHQQQVASDVQPPGGTPLAPVIGGVDAFGANPLANVVAAAAAAAAAANDQKEHHHQLESLNRPQSSLSLGSNTSSSGCAMTPASLISSPDYYQNFKQHCNPQVAQHNQQLQALRQHLQHPLHFSSTPSGSLTHSNSSILGNQSPQSLSSLISSSSNVSQQHNLHHQNQQQHQQQQQQQQRSSSSKTPNSSSSGQMSPISSPNFLRRQFIIGSDRFPSLMSPSPTGSCILNSASISPQVTGSSSSLSHILQHKQQQQHQQQQQQQQQQHSQHQLHNQQRSSSALGGGVGSSAGYLHHPHQTSLNSASSGSLISSGVGSSAVSPLMMSNKNSSQARLNNMQIRHKFGYLGSGRAQFNSPHGFCLGLNQEIVVADTNNHRVCIFDKSGTYITQFGLAGKEEGQLWNPRKVAILHRPTATSGKTGSSVQTADSTTSYQSFYSPTSSSSSPSKITNSGQPIPVSGGTTQSSGIGVISSSGTNSGTCNLSEPLYVVCDRGAERSRMQLFTKDGTFVKKIAIHYIDIVAGLATTQNGLIIVVDSVSPTVYIINGETGVLSSWFDCSGHMKEPSDIAVKSDIPVNEYFICDFKGHCVVVFSEQGEYLRRIGHDGLTSYPNGIDISDDGDILVGDSHGNRFHVVVFDRNGTFVSQFECPHVKVSRCCGLKITREGYIVTLAKNNHHVLVLDTIHI